jgi:hypothetical protein
LGWDLSIWEVFRAEDMKIGRPGSRP